MSQMYQQTKKKMRSYISFFYLLLIVELARPQSIITLKSFNLHQYNIDNHWDAVTTMVNSSLSEIHIEDATIAEEGLEKLLSFNMSGLKVLNLTNCRMNPDVVKTLFQHELIYSLDTLILDKCNLQCEDFAVLKQKKANITKLSLRQNYISAKGFKYLSRLVVNLTKLDLYGNSLIHNDSIDAILSFNLEEILSFNVGKTSISSFNLIRLLRDIDETKVKNLTIRQNVYTPEFYKEFTKINWVSLELLNLYALAIDDEVQALFSSFKLPKLKALVVDNNDLSDEMAIKWINKRNLPELQRLYISQNFIKSSFLSHLVKQSYVFKILELTTTDKNVFSHLSTMDLSSLESLKVGKTKTDPSTVQKFFQTANLTSIKKLQLTRLLNAGNLLNFLLISNLSSVEEINLEDIGDIDSDLLDRVGVFPKLKKLSIKYFNSETLAMKKLVENIQVLAPEIKEFTLGAMHDGFLCESIVNGSLNFKVKKPLEFSFGKLNTLHSDSGMITNIMLRIEPNKTKKVLKTNLDYLHNSVRKQMYETNRMSIKEYSSSTNQLESLGTFIDKYMVNFDFSELLAIRDTPTLVFFKFIHRRYKGVCSFGNLTWLIVTQIDDQGLKLLSKCEFPNLSQLVIYFRLESQKSIVPLNFPYLRVLFLNKLSVPQVKQIIKDGKLKYLSSLVLSGLKLTTADMTEITSSIPFFSRMRVLDLSYNFLNQDLSFLSNSRLENLDLGATMFTSQAYSTICQIPFEFLRNLILSNTGLDDKSMLFLLNCLKDKGEKLFPKLEEISLSGNYLETKGIEAIMSLELPLLNDIRLLKNRDPEIFNSIFKYPSSRRVTQFIGYHNYLSSFDPNIDSRHTRRIEEIYIESESIRSTDIQALSSYKMESLLVFNSTFTKVDDCQSLKYLRDILSSVESFNIMMDQSAGINSSCLGKIQSSQVLPSVAIFTVQYPYGEARNFIEHFFNPGQKLSYLGLQNTFISDAKVLEILRSSDLSKTIHLSLSSNDVSDISIKELLSREYKLLTLLALSKNERITGESFQNMKGFKYVSLKSLFLGETSIGDTGIQYLIRNQFPQLLLLSLSNADLTSKGIIALNQLKAPNLRILDLSCNGLQVDDLALFNVDRFPDLSAIIFYPTLVKEQYDRLKIVFNRGRAKQNLLQIISTVLNRLDSDEN